MTIGFSIWFTDSLVDLPGNRGHYLSEGAVGQA
jgi:hypothetical protein